MKGAGVIGGLHGTFLVDEHAARGNDIEGIMPCAIIAEWRSEGAAYFLIIPSYLTAQSKLFCLT